MSTRTATGVSSLAAAWDRAAREALSVPGYSLEISVEIATRLSRWASPADAVQVRLAAEYLEEQASA